MAAALASTAVALTALAALLELATSRSDAETFPAPGHLWTVGEAQMHLRCTGSGHPTVLLEAGLGESSLTWADVHRSLAEDTRVCSYDRAGHGWSEPRKRPWTSQQAAEELRALLATAQENGPYLVVAHSIGSFVARDLAATSPHEVEGLVLVDPTNDTTVRDIRVPRTALVERRLLGGLTRLGLVRRAGRWLVPTMVDATPPNDLMRQLPATYHATSIAASIQELKGSVTSAERLREVEPPSWGRTPVVVISTRATPSQDRRYHGDLASRSEDGRHVLIEAAGHYAHYEAPSRVTAIVRELVVDVETRQRPLAAAASH
jgi:pimeloyl-ACP methyl ester carboxylesterase